MLPKPADALAAEGFMNRSLSFVNRGYNRKIADEQIFNAMGVEYRKPASPKLSLPHSPYSILPDQRVRGREDQAMFNGLSDLNTVKRIVVKAGQFGDL